MSYSKKYYIKPLLSAVIVDIFAILTIYFALPDTLITNVIAINFFIGFFVFLMWFIIVMLEYEDDGALLLIISFAIAFVPLIIYAEILYIQGVSL